MLPKILSVVAALLYAWAAVALWRWLRQTSDQGNRRWLLTAAVAALIHAAALAAIFVNAEGFDISFYTATLLISLIVVGLSLAGSKKWDLHISGLVVWPTAGLILVLYSALAGDSNRILTASWQLDLHAALAVSAFAVLAIASAQAMLIAVQDHSLRHRRFGLLMHNLPPLAQMETLLFQLIGIGFTLLTITVITGVTYIEDLMAQHLAHKTVLSIAAWAVFGVLLWGRRLYGWRGQFAIKMTLIGIFVLLLAYFGSKLVLEVILQRVG